MSNKIELKFENKIYIVELPDLEVFTGQLSLIFNIKGGLIMTASITKQGSIQIEKTQSLQINSK